MKKGQVWLSCLLGGIIGGAISFACHLQYAWASWLALPVGALVGGLIAYIWYDLEGAKNGVFRAWNETYLEARETWKSLVTFCRLSFWSILFVHLSMYTSVVYIIILLSLFIPAKDLHYSVGFVFCEVLSILISVIIVNGVILNEHDHKKMSSFFKTCTWKYSNPVAVAVWIVVSVIWAIVRVPNGLSFLLNFLKGCMKFLKTSFTYIHSQGRLIVAVDTALGVLLGVALGLHYNNPLMGTLACGFIGMILGEVNYRIVSIRWLKVQPT